MPKRKVGPLPSANNSFVNTLMNHCKFMKKKDKCGNTDRMQLHQNIMKTQVFIKFYSLLFSKTI